MPIDLLQESGSFLWQENSNEILLDSSRVTTFMEPGGDAVFTISTPNGFWSSVSNAPQIVTDFVHGGHIKSTQFRPAQGDNITRNTILTDTGSRCSFYIYLVAVPSDTTQPIISFQNSSATDAFQIRLTTGGILRITAGNGAQLGVNGSTLSTGIWYRISLSYTVTSTTVNEFRLFKNGVLDVSVTNGTISTTVTDRMQVGNIGTDTALDFRISDIFVDNSSSLTDISSDVWVTAKRPFANGTTNGFTSTGTGSGYGTGNAVYVNERPLSLVSFVSVVGTGSAITEEYNIENASTGDIDISAASLLDYMGWVDTKAALSETGQIILNNATSNISIVTVNKVFLAFAASTTYPAGTGTDIGEVTSTTVTTVTLNESGIIFAYTPGVAVAKVSPTQQLMLSGVGT